MYNFEFEFEVIFENFWEITELRITVSPVLEIFTNMSEIIDQCRTLKLKLIMSV